MNELSTGPRAHGRGLAVDGNTGIRVNAIRPRAHEAFKCTWREACKAADYVLENFGDQKRDRGLWVWYCQRLGLDAFLELADEVVSCWRQGEIRYPVRAFQRHLKDALPREVSSPVGVGLLPSREFRPPQ